MGPKAAKCDPSLGSDHLVYSLTAVAEVLSLPIWGVQVGTDKPEYRMNQMLEFLGQYALYVYGSEETIGAFENDSVASWLTLDPSKHETTETCRRVDI